MTKTGRLKMNIGLYLLVHKDKKDIPEDKLMDFIRANFSYLLSEPCRPEETIPEVVKILNQWIHAGLIRCKTETNGPTTFSVRDDPALWTIITEHLNLFPLTR